MKYVLLIFVIISMISCTKKSTDTALCFTKLTCNVNENSLEPTVIRIDFLDKESLIQNSIQKGKFKKILFYAIDEKNRGNSYMKKDFYEKKDDTTTLYLGINYFDRDKNHRWEQKEIEDFLIKSDIGLVIGNDTLIVKLCKY